MRRIIIAAVVAVALAGCASSGQSAEPTETTTIAPAAEVPADPHEALVVALQAGDADALKAALDRGADPSAEIGPTTPALHAAVRRQDSALVQALLEAGADVTVADRTGYTALHRAAELGNGDIISFAGQDEPWARDFFRAGTYVFIGGAAVSVLTALTGFWDWLRSTQPGTQARRTANAHALAMVTGPAPVRPVEAVAAGVPECRP